MKITKQISLALFCFTTTSLLAQYSPFQKDSIRFESNSRSHARYGIKYQYNDDLLKDGDYLIYDCKDADTVIVGRMHYRSGMLVDSAVINTPDYKFNCFFLWPEGSYTSILIPALKEKAVPHGHYELSEYSNGTMFLYENYSYQYGRKNGLCREYRLNSWDDPDEGQWQIYNMSDDILEGPYLRYCERGDTLEYGVYASGKKDGSWYIYHLYDKSREIASYKNGALDGVSKIWNKNNQLIAELSYRDNKQDGLCRRWYDNGQLSSESLYKKGFIQRYTMWHDNGKVYVQEQYDSVGRMYGARECYYKDGKRERIVHFVQGDKEGLAEYWNEKGILIERSNYHHNELEGKAEYFYDSGQRRMLSYYSNGKLNGVHKRWDEKGKLIVHQEYKNDVLVKTYLYNDGKQIVLEGGDMMGEGMVFEDEYIRADFKSRCTNIEYNVKAQRCVLEYSCLLADMLNTYYASLSKKEQKKWQRVKQLVVYCEVKNDQLIISGVSGGDAEWNAEILAFSRKCNGKPCGSIYPCSIKVTLIPAFSEKK